MNFKPIRNLIRKFTYESLTGHLLKILKDQERREGPQPFWHPLILLKWTLEFAAENHPPRQAEMKDVVKLLKMLESLEMNHDTFNLKRNGQISKTFTILAFQQFQYQERPWFETFARQYVLFEKVKHRYDINESFKKKTRLSVTDFLKGLSCLWMGVLNAQTAKMRYEGHLEEYHLSLLKSLLNDEKAVYFLELLMISRKNIRSVLEEDKRSIRNYDLQVFETSIFSRKPILLFNNWMIIPHKDILNHTVNHFIYEYMKNRDDRFSEELGERMERYIEIGLKENEIPHVTEDDLRRKFGKQSNVVDFVAEETILIESKAIELRPVAGINPTDALLASEMDHNIVKAYAQQMLTVVQALNTQAECFGVIVTYKKLHLGDTQLIWDQFLKSATLKLLPDEEKIGLLPPKNLFFFDLATWDLVMQIIKTHKLTLKEILIDLRNDIESEVRFGTDMYLDKYKITRYDLAYLDHKIF